MNNMAYIEFDNVDKVYQMGEVEIKALNKASFSIDKGELVVFPSIPTFNGW